MPDPIQKIALSRYAAQALAARPELAAEVDGACAARAPFSAAEMARALQGSDSGPPVGVGVVLGYRFGI